MGMTLNDFEAKALQVLLSQRFLSLPLFEEEELSEYHIADNQGEMNLEDFIGQYSEVITEQFKFDYENRLKADMVAMLTELHLKMKEIGDDLYPTEDWDYGYKSGVEDMIQLLDERIDRLKDESDAQEQKKE